MKKRLNILKIELLSIILLLSISTNNIVRSHNKYIKSNTIEFEKNNEELVNLYNNYINIVSEYFKNKYDNPFDICSEFGFMIYSGLLSSGSDFSFNNPEYDITSYGGLDVINGKGTCRNINCLFTEILDNIGYECGNIYGTLNKKGEHDFRPNHVVTWVKLDDNIYLLDPTNLSVFNKTLFGYKNSRESIFIPSLIITKKFNIDVESEVVFFNNLDEKKEIDIVEWYNCDNLSDCINFEKNDLESIEKQIVLKLDTLHNE